MRICDRTLQNTINYSNVALRLTHSMVIQNQTRPPTIVIPVVGTL